MATFVNNAIVIGGTFLLHWFLREETSIPPETALAICSVIVLLTFRI